MLKISRLLVLLALFYAEPAVTEQHWSGFQDWMVGQPCSTQIDRIENTCHMAPIEFKRKHRKVTIV